MLARLPCEDPTFCASAGKAATRCSIGSADSRDPAAIRLLRQHSCPGATVSLLSQGSESAISPSSTARHPTMRHSARQTNPMTMCVNSHACSSTCRAWQAYTPLNLFSEEFLRARDVMLIECSIIEKGNIVMVCVGGGVQWEALPICSRLPSHSGHCTIAAASATARGETAAAQRWLAMCRHASRLANSAGRSPSGRLLNCFCTCRAVQVGRWRHRVGLSGSMSEHMQGCDMAKTGRADGCGFRTMRRTLRRSDCAAKTVTSSDVLGASIASTES